MTLKEQALLTANALENLAAQCNEGWGREDASPVVITALREHATDLRKAAEVPTHIGHFDICTQMVLDGLDLQRVGGENILALNKVKAGTNITVGFPGDLVSAIGIEGKYLFCAMAMDRNQYFATKKRLEQGGGTPTQRASQNDSEKGGG